MPNDAYRAHRNFLTDALRKQADFSSTDQNRGIPALPLQKPYPPDSTRLPLAGLEIWSKAIPKIDLITAMGNRKSRRDFSDQALTLEELSFLLWSTQGIRQILSRGSALRMVPSAGARHSFETYLFIRHVEGIAPGLYRFLPLENELLFIRTVERMKAALAKASLGQHFVGSGALTFVWGCIPQRMEWRYGLTAHRVILMDVGHVCQNLYLACEGIGAGTCAVAAYDQEEMDRLLGLDGLEEFAIYCAPVGKPGQARSLPEVAHSRQRD